MKKDSEVEDPEALKKRLFDESDNLLRRIAVHLITDPESEKHYSATLVRMARRWIEQNPDLVEADPVKQTTKKVVEPINDTKQPIKARQINVRITAEQDRLLKQYCVRNDVTTQDAVIKALQGLIDGFESDKYGSDRIVPLAENRAVTEKSAIPYPLPDSSLGFLKMALHVEADPESEKHYTKGALRFGRELLAKHREWEKESGQSGQASPDQPKLK